MALGTQHPQQGAFSPVEPQTWLTETSSLGAHIDGATTTFAVYSRNATRVLLEIYDDSMAKPARFDYGLARGPDNVWRGRIKNVPPGTFYGFRCWGPNWPFSEEWRRGNSNAGFLSDVDGVGNRFNPNKFLFDPYAR